MKVASAKHPLVPKEQRINPDWEKLPLFERKDWKRVRFGDVVKNVNETERNPIEAGIERFIAMEHLEPGSLHVRETGSVLVGTTFNRRCRPGQVLFGKRRAYQRKVAIAELDAVVSGDIYVFAAKEDRLLPGLLPFLCLSERFYSLASETSAGSLSPRTNWSSLASFEFSLPPLAQQRHIADILIAGNDCDRHFTQALVDAMEFRRITILNLFRNGIGHSEFIDTPLGKRPTGWEIAPLGRHYEVQLGKMMSPNALIGPTKRPYIRNANVQWDRLDLSDLATMSFSEREVRKYELRYGDVLACEGRHVGKSAIWRNEIPGACYQKAVHRLRALNDDQAPEFLLYQMEHHSVSGIFADTTGETTIPHLPAERLRAIYFAFPAKLEQQEIVSQIRRAGDLVSRLKTSIEMSRGLMQTFVDKLIANECA